MLSLHSVNHRYSEAFCDKNRVLKSLGEKYFVLQYLAIYSVRWGTFFPVNRELGLRQTQVPYYVVYYLTYLVTNKVVYYLVSYLGRYR